MATRSPMPPPSDRVADHPPGSGPPVPADPVAVLDAALEAVSGLEWEAPVPYANHAPMACEALATLGRHEVIGAWVADSVATLVQGPPPVPPRRGAAFATADALGDRRLLPEWTGYLAQAIADDGWEAAVSAWVPRLMPGLSTGLFHGVIRTAHAVRSLEQADTPTRRMELAWAIGHWASRFEPGRPVDGGSPVDDAPRAAVLAAARGAAGFVAAPDIVHLHGVTGAMAVALLSRRLTDAEGSAAVAQLRAEHAGIYPGTARRDRPGGVASWDHRIVAAASASFDPHQVKMVEACLRGFQMTGDGVFVAAATGVVGPSAW